MKNNYAKKHVVTSAFTLCAVMLSGISGLMHAAQEATIPVTNRGPENIPGMVEKSDVKYAKHTGFTGHGPAVIKTREHAAAWKLSKQVFDEKGIQALEQFATNLNKFSDEKKNSISYNDFISAVRGLGNNLKSNEPTVQAAIDALKAAVSGAENTATAYKLDSSINIKAKPLSDLPSIKRFGHKGEYNPAVKTEEKQVEEENERTAEFRQVKLVKEQIRLLKAALVYLSKVIHFYKVSYAVENDEQIREALRSIFLEFKKISGHFSGFPHRQHKQHAKQPGKGPAKKENLERFKKLIHHKANDLES